MSKQWWRSRTILVNILMAVAVIIQAATGEAWLSPEVQGAIIVVVNLALRIITKQGLER